MRNSQEDHLPAKKIGLLHVAKKQIGLDDDSYRDVLRLWGGVESSSQLDTVGFEKVMIRMEQLGFRSTRQKQNFGNRAGMATPAQIGYIRELWKKYQGPKATEAALNAWLLHFHKVSALRFVSSDRAAKIIPALKAMSSRQ